jgi:proteasome assembly chaperone (PAC2) family protein
MKMLKQALFTCAVVAVISASGCAPVTTASTGFNITSKLDEDEVKWFTESGTGTITGQAFLRQRGGGVVKGAGETVYLTPASGYFMIPIAAG